MREESDQKARKVCSTYDGYSYEIVASWVRKNLSDPRQIKRAAQVEKLEEQIYQKLDINPADFDLSAELPENMTKEHYVATYRKIFATLRHDFYMRV